MTHDMTADRSSELDAATRFAKALDEEDYVTARDLLHADCVYTIDGKEFRGPEAIVGSYKGNGDTAARVFDEIRYGSAVAAGPDGWIVVTFSDHIRHDGKALDHVCEQWVRIDPHGKVIRIEHRDLPGERERLEAFKRSAR